jgi:hypothetical protein
MCDVGMVSNPHPRGFLPESLDTRLKECYEYT